MLELTQGIDWPANNNDVRSQDVSTSSAGDHSHSFSGSFSVTSDSGTASGTTGGQNPTTNNEGGGGSHENRPPYYALCYIMKTQLTRLVCLYYNINIMVN